MICHNQVLKLIEILVGYGWLVQSNRVPCYMNVPETIFDGPYKKSYMMIGNTSYDEI